MDEEAVFKRYDIRGRYPEELNEEFAELLGKSLGTFVNRKYRNEVVVVRDNKKTSRTLKNSFIQGLKDTGIKVLDADTGPTDYTAYTGKEEDAVSVQVTSSHLPLEFNGFKFMYPEGNGFTNPDLNEVKNIFRSRDFDKGEGYTEKLENPLKNYKEELRKVSKQISEDWDKKVVVDSLGGATENVLADVLRSLGAKVVEISEDKPCKPYQDPPNPKPEYLQELKDKVKETEADLGLATDMDGDRVTAYKNGFLTGDEVFSVFAQLIPGNTVASIDSSQALQTIVESRGDKVFYTRVGDPFVMDKAIKEQVGLAGEPNGHYAFLDFVPYSSGTLSGLILAGIPLEDYLGDIPDYYTLRQSIEVKNKEDKMDKIADLTEQRYDIGSKKDGVKINEETFTALVRPSGSSPKIRIIIESSQKDTASQVMEDIGSLVRNA